MTLSFLQRLPLVRPLSDPETAPLRKKILGLAWPSLVENLLQTLLGVSDMIMVGHLGENAIAGVGLGLNVMNLLIVTFSGLSVGNMAMVARFVGAGRPDQAEKAAKQSLLIGGTLAMIIAMVGAIFSPSILRLMGATPEVVQVGTVFLSIFIFGSIFLAIMQIGGGTLRGAGDTRTPMVITGIINVINIVLAYGLIFGQLGFPAMGVAGSALATTIARGVGSLLTLWALFLRQRGVHLTLKGNWRPDREIVARLLKIGLPSAGEQAIFQLGLMAFSIIVVSLGTADLAAQQIAFNIASLSVLPAFAFSIAAATMVGQSLGANQPEDARRSAILTTELGMMWMLSMGIVFALFRSQFVALYTSEAEVIRLGSGLMLFIACGQAFQAVSIVLSGALRGAGDTRYTLLMMVVGVWVGRVGVGWLMGIVLGLGLYGVWLGWAVDFVSRAILIVLRFRSGRWQKSF